MKERKKYCVPALARAPWALAPLPAVSVRRGTTRRATGRDMHCHSTGAKLKRRERTLISHFAPWLGIQQFASHHRLPYQLAACGRLSSGLSSYNGSAMGAAAIAPQCPATLTAASHESS
jgi:hypothetical protein